MAIAAMIVVAAVAVVAVEMLARVIRADRRDHAAREREWAKERRDLLNRIMHLAEKPWEPPDLGPGYSDETADPYEILFPEEEPLS